MALWKWKMKTDAPASPHGNDAGQEPREPMTEARRRSLEDVMEAILLTTRDQIIQGRKWRHSTETRALELEIDRRYSDVLAGKGKLIDFSEACKKWMLAGTELK